MYHWWIPLSVVTAAAAAAFASVEIESYHTNGFLAEPVPQIARQVADFMLVTDLDIHSKAGNSWAAALKTGRLFSNSSGGYNVEPHSLLSRYTIEQQGNSPRSPTLFVASSFPEESLLVRDSVPLGIRWLAERNLTTRYSMGGRSMELSEVVRFGNQTLAFCDKTGLVFEVTDTDAYGRLILMDGNGYESKPFKAEWSTVKDGRLLVGSVGKEWVTPTGATLHRNMEWVKMMDPLSHRVDSVCWSSYYAAMRAATNTSEPGYLWHEAIIWDSSISKWIAVPRKASVGALYDEVADETRGTNILIIANEDFTDIQVSTVGPLEPEYGFAAIRKIPGSSDYVGVKVREIGTSTQSKLVVFGLDGSLKSDWIEVSTYKFEGIEFMEPNAVLPIVENALISP